MISAELIAELTLNCCVWIFSTSNANSMLGIINPCKAITRLINQDNGIRCLIKQGRIMAHKYSIHWNMACEFIQTNTGACNLHNRTVLPYKWSLTNTIHGVKWIENVITPMLRLVNANNIQLFILCEQGGTRWDTDDVERNLNTALKSPPLPRH